MLIVCPSCASEYVLDAARLPREGRTVRCAGCRETFLVTAEEVAQGLAQQAAQEAEQEAMQDAVKAGSGDAITLAASATRSEDSAVTGDGIVPRHPAGRPRIARRAVKPVLSARLRAVPTALWIALAALAGLTGLVAVRASVVAQLPQTARLYAAVGLPVNLRGLELHDVLAYATPGSEGELTVEGDVVNVRRTMLALPSLVLELQDGHGDAVRRFTAPPPRDVLEPAESARFHVTLAAPPAAALGVLVSFGAEIRAAAEPAPTAEASLATVAAAAAKGHAPTTEALKSTAHGH